MDTDSIKPFAAFLNLATLIMPGSNPPLQATRQQISNAVSEDVFEPGDIRQIPVQAWPWLIAHGNKPMFY